MLPMIYAMHANGLPPLSTSYHTATANNIQNTDIILYS